MFYTLKTIFMMIRLAEIVTWEPAAFSLDDFVLGPPGDIFREKVAAKSIMISDNITLPATIETDSHGYGALAIANLTSEYVKVYDECHYRHWLLSIKFADFDGDGYRDLVIYGIEDFYGEKDDNHKKIRGSRPIIRIYYFNPGLRQFEPFFIYAPTERPIYD